MTKKIALIDGYGFVFRAYHALPPLTRDDGTPVGAVYGFTNMLLRLLAGFNISHISMVFDSGSKTFRNELYPAYKANRPPCPEDLIPQFSLIREATEAFNLHILEKVGYEADDLIATIARNAAKNDFEVVIVSSDKDLMQLVGDKISMFDAMRNRTITAKEVEEKFLVPPIQVLDVLSLMGDSSDNIPGVKGIGPKTAAELISNYGTLENLLENLDEIKQDKRRQILKESVELAKLSKQLASLCENVPVDLDMEQFKVKNIEPLKLINFLQIQGFRSLKQKVMKEFNIEVLSSENSQQSSNSVVLGNISQNSNSNEKNNEIGLNFAKIAKIKIKNAQELQEIISHWQKPTALIIDIEFEKNTQNGENGAKKIIFSLISDHFHQKSYQIILKTESSILINQSSDLFSSNLESEKSEAKFEITLEDFIKSFKDIISAPQILKIGYKIKEIYKFFAKNGLIFTPAEDISVMAYILNSASNKSNIRNLIDLNLDENIEENGFGEIFEDLEKEKEPKLFLNEGKKDEFYFFKNYAIWRLYNLLKDQIFEQKLNFVYQRFEKPLMPVLAKIEMEGILVDKLRLKELSAQFANKIQKLTAEIHQMAGEEFNIGSPQQLSHILFEKLNLPAGKRSKTGAYSTDSDILENLELSGHEIAAKVLEWRQVSKLKSTYSDSLQNNINDKTGRIHTTFSNIIASTGRLSSINPNLQNIPIRSAEGRQIRSAFIAKKGYKFVLADYSQVELRILAHMADISALKQAFQEDKDIHRITAAQIFGIAESEMSSEIRSRAKAINFGIIYGISAFGLARQLRIERKDAANYIKSYFETYPGIQNYMKKYQELALENGFVTTITGRKCFINGIDSKNPVIKGLAERLAINAPIQGSAADIIKKAMIDLDEILSNNNFDARMILQVHDELILEVAENQVEEVSAILKKTMENAILLDLPLRVDVKISQSW